MAVTELDNQRILEVHKKTAKGSFILKNGLLPCKSHTSEQNIRICCH